MSSESQDEGINDQGEKIRRYKFSENEDRLLITLVSRFGTKSWATIASFMRGRTSRQCRDRYNHYLSPETSKDEWTKEEDEVIINQLKLVGKQWTYISTLLPGRTSIGVRNRSCKLSRMHNADPVVKELLKDEYKKKPKKEKLCISENTDTDAKFKLPSCQDLLDMIGRKDYCIQICNASLFV